METKLYILLICICLCIVYGQDDEKTDETTPNTETDDDVTSEDYVTTEEDIAGTEKEVYTTNDPNTPVLSGENEDVTTQAQTDSTDKDSSTEIPEETAIDQNTEQTLSTDFNTEDGENSFTSTEEPDESSGSDPPSDFEPTDRNEEKQDKPQTEDDIEPKPVSTESSEIGEGTKTDSETSITTTTETTTPDPQSKMNPKELCKVFGGTYGELGCDYWCCGYLHVNPIGLERFMYFQGQKKFDEECIIPGRGRYSGTKSVCTALVLPLPSWSSQSFFGQYSSPQSCPYLRNVKSTCRPSGSFTPPGRWW